MDPEALAYVILGVILIATFISIFFFTYVSKVEADVVKIQMNRIISNLTSDSGLILTPEQKAAVGMAITNNLSVPDMSTEDAQVAANNKSLKLKAAKVFGALILVGLVVVGFLWQRYNLNMGQILKYSLIILGLVALTEFLFVSQISKNYDIVDPNYVRYLIANNLKGYAQS